MGRRRHRRPAYLLAIVATVGLGIVAAVAGAAILKKSPLERAGSLSIRLTPSTRTVTPGGSATYALRVELGPSRSRGLGGRTRLSVGAGLPSGVHASFSPESTVVARGTSHLPSKLTIRTGPGTAAGTYRFKVRARRPHGSGDATATLIVAPAAKVPAPIAPAPGAPAPVAPVGAPPVVRAPRAFTVSGTLPGLLEPGSGAPLDLSLTSNEGVGLAIADLTVTIAAVSAPHADAQHPCGPADFSVAQFSGPIDFTLPALSTATLAELGFDEAQWPMVTMIDSASNQNGCKGASLHLAFAGSATEVTS